MSDSSIQQQPQMPHVNILRKKRLILQLSSFLLAVTQEIPELAGVDVMLYMDEEPLIELKGTRKLFHQLPNTLDELVNNRGYLLWISI